MLASDVATMANLRIGTDTLNMRFSGLWDRLLAAVAVGAVAAVVTDGN
jgi:hypothetical protein